MLLSNRNLMRVYSLISPFSCLRIKGSGTPRHDCISSSQQPGKERKWSLDKSHSWWAAESNPTQVLSPTRLSGLICCPSSPLTLLPAYLALSCLQALTWPIPEPVMSYTLFAGILLTLYSPVCLKPSCGDFSKVPCQKRHRWTRRGQMAFFQVCSLPFVTNTPRTGADHFTCLSH